MPVAQTPAVGPSTSLFALRLLPAGVIAAAGIAVQFFQLPNDDATWLFAVARRMSEGATLYSSDLVEMNPPLIIQVSGLAIWLGRWLGIESMSAWRLLVGAFTVLSLWLSARLLRTLLGARGADLHTPFMLVLAAGLACLPGYNFGEREHLILLCLIPYVVAAAGRATGCTPVRWEAITVGLMAAFALSFKPHFLLALILIELGLLFHRVSWTTVVRIETIALAAGVIVELVLIAVLHPQYLTVAVPMALAYYPSYGSISVRPWHLMYLLIAIGAVVCARTPRAAALATRLFALAGVGAFGAFVVQGKDWPYHFLPAKALLLVTGGFGLCTLARGVIGQLLRTRPSSTRSRLRAIAIGSALAVVMLVIGVQAVQTSANQNTRRVKRIRDFIEAVEPPGRPKTFSSLATTLWPAFPVNELLKTRWTSRFSCLWLLPGLEAREAVRTGMPRDETGWTYLETALSEDLDRERPTLVLVERNQPGIETLLNSARLAASWRHYHTVGDVDAFRLYVRKDDDDTRLPGIGASTPPP